MFIYDNTDLDYPKTDLTPIPGGADPTQYVVASDWNTLCQAVVDIKTAIRTGTWYGFDDQASDPAPVGITDYIWMDSTKNLRMPAGLQATTINGITVLTGADDPSAGAGVEATIPAIYIRTGTEQVWLKTDATDIAWTLLVLNGSAAALTTLTTSGEAAFSGPTRLPFATLTYASPTTINAALAAVYELTLTGATAMLQNPTNLQAGMQFTIIVHQDGTGGRGLTFDTFYDFGNEIAPVLTGQAANKTNVISCLALSTTQIACTALLGFS